MSQSIEQQGSVHPLVAYAFRVDVDGTTMSFTEVSGLAREMRTVTYRHGLSYTEGEQIAVFRHEVFAPITFKRGVVPGVKALYEWLESQASRALTVSLVDHTGAPVVQWKVQRAYLTKIDAPALQASANDAAVETLTVMACGVAVEHV